MPSSYPQDSVIWHKYNDIGLAFGSALVLALSHHLNWELGERTGTPCYDVILYYIFNEDIGIDTKSDIRNLEAELLGLSLTVRTYLKIRHWTRNTIVVPANVYFMYTLMSGRAASTAEDLAF